MPASGGRPPGRTLPPPFNPPGGAPKPASDPNSPGSTSPGVAPAKPQRAARPSQPPPASGAAPPAAAPAAPAAPQPSAPVAAPIAPTHSGPTVPNAVASGPATAPSSAMGKPPPGGHAAARPAPRAPAPAKATQLGYPVMSPTTPPTANPPPAATEPAPTAPPAPASASTTAPGMGAAAPAAEAAPPAAPGGLAAPAGFPPPQGYAQGFGGSAAQSDPVFVGSGGPGDDSMITPVKGQFAGLIEISARRAPRIAIDPSQVMPTERAALELASPPVTDPSLQAFLGWRRSVLLVATVLLVPLVIFSLWQAVRLKVPGMLRLALVLPVLANVALTAACVLALRSWTLWRQQRRTLLYGWLVFMLAPCVVYLLPLRSSLASSLGASNAEQQGLVLLGTTVAMIALLEIAPRVLSLGPGLVRSALVAKLLFPGSAGAGWLVLLAAPVVGVVAFLMLVIPYHVTGSGWFALGLVLLVGAQFLLARAGSQLARPTSEGSALTTVNRMRTTYLLVMAVAGVVLIIGIARLTGIFELGKLWIATAILGFLVNTLVVTLVGTDLVITNLERARALGAATSTLAEESNTKLAAFSGSGAPQ